MLHVHLRRYGQVRQAVLVSFDGRVVGVETVRDHLKLVQRHIVLGRHNGAFAFLGRRARSFARSGHRRGQSISISSG